MIVKRVWKKRPYWVDSLEDRPNITGWGNWSSIFFNEADNIQEQLKQYKFNQISYDTFELCWSAPTTDFNFPNLYFEILVNKKTYYIYVEQISKIYNGGAVYICKVDNWITYCINILHSLEAEENVKLLVVRGHFEDDKQYFVDEKLEEVYHKIPGRSTELLVENETQKLISLSVDVSNKLYAVFQEDNIDIPYLIIPVLAFHIGGISFQGDPTKYFNNSFFIQHLLLDAQAGFTNKFVGFFVGPVFNALSFVNREFTISGLDQPKQMVKVANISIGDFLKSTNNNNCVFRLIAKRNSFKSYDFSFVEFWKINTRDRLKSLAAHNLLNYQYEGQRFNFAKMFISDNAGYDKLDFKGKTIFNGKFTTILDNPKLNRDERIFTYPDTLPTASSGYAAQIQGIYNQTNTGLQIAKENYIRQQSYNLVEGIFGGISAQAEMGGKALDGDFGEAFQTGFRAVWNPLKTGIENAYSYNQKKRTIASKFKDMQLNALPNVNNSLDTTILNVVNTFKKAHELNITQISRDKVNESIIIGLNNVITKYGFYVWKYFNWSELFVNIETKTEDPLWTNPSTHSYVQLESDCVQNILLPWITKNFDSKVPKNVIWELCEQLISGIRIWRNEENIYIYSKTQFIETDWN